ncbi:hypothetical protein STEG23_029174 [Scotinomys teguina]
MTVTSLGRDQDCSLKNREPNVPAPWYLDPGGWSKTTTVRLYFIFPGICTLSLFVYMMHYFDRFLYVESFMHFCDDIFQFCGVHVFEEEPDDSPDVLVV